MDLKSLQKPLKEHYRSNPAASRITLKAKGGQTETPIACSVAIGHAIYNAEAHTGVGGAGTAACSGDLLLGAMSACAQITCQMVAAAMGIPTERIEVTVEGDLDLRGTLGIAKEIPSAFSACTCDLTLRRPTPQRSNCRRCAKRRNNTAWLCRRWSSRRSCKPSGSVCDSFYVFRRCCA